MRHLTRWAAAAATLLLLAVVLRPARAAEEAVPIPVFGDVAAVSRERPRMLLTPASLAATRRRIRSDPVSRRLFAAMKQRCDGMLGMQPTLDNGGRHYLPSFALLYALTGEERYASIAKRWLLLMAQEDITNSWTCLEYIPTAAFAFDWIHDALSADERRRAAEGLLRQLALIKKLWRHSDYNNHFVLEHMSQLHVALTLAHEPGFEDEAARLFAESEKWLKENVIPASNEMAGGTDATDADRAGGHAEGFSYASWGYARPLGRLLAAWQSATGEDLFARSVQFRHDAVWNAYGRLPDGTMTRGEDCPSTHRWGQDARSTFELIAREYGDGIAQTLAGSIDVRYPQVIWPILLFHDPAVAPEPLATLPRARLFGALGHVYSRSSWDDADAVVATFQCGPVYAGHQHLDNNAFTIFARTRLAIDSGVNEYSAHRANYYSRTVAHNTITVLDPAETFPAAVWSAGGEGGSNDGGQRRVPFPTRVTAAPDEKAVRDVGRITHFERNEEYCYAVGDATRSYAPGKVERFVRHFLHRYPDLVLVLDEIETGDAAFETRWLLHTVEEPRLRDGVITAENGDGALTVWPLLPPAAEREVRVVGGPGRAFMAGGRNYPPDAKSDPGAGSYRVEVVDTERRTRHVFLHALLAGPAATRKAEAARWTITAAVTGSRVRIDLERRAGGGRPALRETWTLSRGGLLAR